MATGARSGGVGEQRMGETTAGRFQRDFLKLAACIATGALLPLSARAASAPETMAQIAVGPGTGSCKKRGVDVTDVLTFVGGGTSLRDMIGGCICYAEFRHTIDQGFRRQKASISAPHSTSETPTQMALEKAGMSGEASLGAIGPMGTGLSALGNGGINAALIVEPLRTRREKRYVTALTPHGLPLMSTNFGVATLDFIRSSPEILRNLIAGRREAVDFLCAHIGEAAAMVSRRYGNTLLADVAPAVIHRMADIQYWSRGNFETEAFESVIEALKRQGSWSGPVDWNKLTDRSFLPDDLKAWIGFTPATGCPEVVKL